MTSHAILSKVKINPAKNTGAPMNTHVPNNNCLLRPLDSSLEVCTICDVIIKELEQMITLIFFKADDVTCN